MGIGNSIAESMVKTQRSLQKEMMELQWINMMRGQQRMMRQQMAYQKAMAKDRTMWFGGSAALVGCAASALHIVQKNPFLWGPFVGLSIVTAFNYDLAYGTKFARIDKWAQEEMKDGNNWFAPPIISSDDAKELTKKQGSAQ
mmetsp:Transcript_3102/g.3444  ORF Transcript_3102/g.3444 Transcript_3102/m.3444 type:complete len:142 (+) Transcript_3102:20-445(+)